MTESRVVDGPFRGQLRYGANPSGAIRSAAVSLLLVAMAGCSVKPVPVSGKVTLDGKPVADCGVLFIPVGQRPRATEEVASGQTDAQGCFTLSTRKISGAMPGDYCVTLSKRRTLGMVGSMPGPNGVSIEWIVPERYSRPETSGLQKTVSTQEHEFAFDLSSK